MNRVLVFIGSSARGGWDGILASDRAALGLALRQGAGAVRAFCPTADERAMTFALAAGAAEVGSLAEIQPQTFDVALVGHGALDSTLEEPEGSLAGRLAEMNRATLVFDVLDVARVAERLIVSRDEGRGRREELVLEGPAVLVISPQARRPPYVSRFRMQAAAQMLRRANAAFGGSPPPADDWQPARPRAKLGSRGNAPAAAGGSRMDEAFGLGEPAPSGDPEHVLQADPATCARHLLRYLAHHGFVERDDLKSSIDVEVAAPQPAFAAVVPAPDASVANSQASTIPDELASIRRVPRRADEPPERIARQPRRSAAQPAASPPPSVARRPRSAGQADTSSRRGLRPIS